MSIQAVPMIGDVGEALAVPEDEAALEECLSRPDAATIAAVTAVPGDFLVLGAGGKMGLSLSRMLRRALDDGGRGRSLLLAVSRLRRRHGGGVRGSWRSDAAG